MFGCIKLSRGQTCHYCLTYIGDSSCETHEITRRNILLYPERNRKNKRCQTSSSRSKESLRCLNLLLMHDHIMKETLLTEATCMILKVELRFYISTLQSNEQRGICKNYVLPSKALGQLFRSTCLRKSFRFTPCVVAAND